MQIQMEKILDTCSCEICASHRPVQTRKLQARPRVTATSLV